MLSLRKKIPFEIAPIAINTRALFLTMDVIRLLENGSMLSAEKRKVKL